MLLFAREIHLSGTRLREAIGLATHLAEYSAQVTGVPVNVWSTVYSPAANTLAFTAYLPDMTALEAALDKLTVDDEFHNQADRLATHTVPGSLTDRLVTIIHPAEFPAAPPATSYARVIRSTAQVSRIDAAVELGVRVAARAEDVTGAATLFGAEATGSFIGLTWIYGYADAAEAERFDLKIGADPELMELLRRTPDLFMTGESTRTMYRKVI